ncbi:MAG: leucine--tRNA ligase, partial [Syntrophomonadaceae bacterium]|nr:leucine--tRNA ligase [Syntrophomonadaceae bacterium]
NLENKKSVHLNAWPVFDPKLIRDKEIELVVQVNGKVRDKIKVSADISEEDARNIALGSEKVTRWLEGKMPKKVIIIKGKLISIVL